MNLALTVLEIVTPVFALAGIGFLWVKAGFEYRVEFVTRLSMTLAVPVLIFVALVETEVTAQVLTQISLASVVAYAGVTLACWVAVWLTGLNRRTYLAPMIMANTGNIGLPLALFAFGETGLGLAVVVFAIMAIYSFTFGVWLVADTSNPLTVIKEPMVGATVLGALFLWQGWEPPAVVMNTLGLISQLAIPLMLITLGVAVARLAPGNLTRAVWVSLLKAAICVGIAWVVGRWFELPPVAFGVLVLQLGTPVAVTNYLLAEKYGADSNAVAGLVVVSTLLSVALLPLILAAVL
ncbi:AEC family transporter [Shimia ponticola]|uniref:AEC family transporter n=1 Tax=Shimia ponticola TaxID=2582893 RepID=UPI0011BE4E3C|nr:AEC family transporter [Shimia ponticola]